MSEDRERSELEGRIRELEATVETLTSELMDATERIRELEAELDAEPQEDTDSPVSDAWIPATEEVAAEDDSTEDADDGSRRESDDIIVA